MAVGGGKNVNVELTASVGGFVRGFKSALGSLGRFKSRLGAGLGAIGGVVKSLAKYAAIGVGAITALTVAAGYMAIKMVKGNQEVEAALGEMASLGFTALDKLRQAAVDWTNSWGGDAAEFIRSSYAIKSAISTLTDDAVAEFARLAALTAAATKATVGDMTDLFASAYGTYKQNYKSMSDMDFGKMLSGGIAGAVQAFNTNGPKMKRALEALGSAATIAGQKMEEQFAILGTLQRTMQPGVAGTAYRAFISGAAKGIEMLRKEIDTLSKSKSAADKKEVASLKKLLAGMVDKEGRLRSTADILEAVREKYGDVIDTAEQVQIEKMFGGMEGFKLVAELIKDIGALRKNTADMAKAMGGGTKKTEEMADAMKTGKMKAEAFWSSLKNLKDEFAKGYSGVYEDMLERVRLKLVAAQKPAKEWAAKAKVWWAEHKDAALAYVDKGLKAVEDAWPKMQAKAEAALDWLKKNIPIAFGKLKSALTTIKDVGVEIAGAIVPIAKTLAVWATYDPATFGLALVVTAIVALFGGPAGLAALVALLSFKLGEAAGKADGLKGKLTEMLSTFATEIETSGWEEALLGPFARLPENLNKALTGVADELAAWAAQQTWFEDMMNGIDSVVEGVSGTFFDEQIWEALADLIIRFDPYIYNPLEIRKRAERFGVERFKQEMQEFVALRWNEFARCEL